MKLIQDYSVFIGVQVYDESKDGQAWNALQRKNSDQEKLKRNKVKGTTYVLWAVLSGSVAMKLPANAGDIGLIPGPGRFPEEKNGNSLQYSYLGNTMDRGT